MTGFELFWVLCSGVTVGAGVCMFIMIGKRDEKYMKIRCHLTSVEAYIDDI